jgi:hypothetical protein
VLLRHCNSMSTANHSTCEECHGRAKKVHWLTGQPRPGHHSTSVRSTLIPTTPAGAPLPDMRVRGSTHTAFGVRLHLRVGSCRRMHGLGCRGSGVTDVGFSSAIAPAARTPTHKTWRAQCVVRGAAISSWERCVQCAGRRAFCAFCAFWIAIRRTK